MSPEPEPSSRPQFLKGAVVLGGVGALEVTGGVALWRLIGTHNSPGKDGIRRSTVRDAKVSIDVSFFDLVGK